MDNTLKLLVVEDNPEDIELVSRMLTKKQFVNFEVETVARMSEAVLRLEKGGVDLILLDLGLPDSQGMGTYREIQRAAPKTPVIILSGNEDFDLAVGIIKEGAQDFYVKGSVKQEALVRSIHYALERKRATEKLNIFNAELEIRVEKRTKELEEANKQLKSFSYSISHDLKAPIRAIEGFSAILESDYSKTMDTEARRLVSLIRGGALKMKQLVEDLLLFHTYLMKELASKQVNIYNLAQSVLAEIKSHNTTGKAVDAKINPLPDALCDSALIRQVFINLISNAVKFTSKTETPEIEVGGEIINGFNRYYVKDNGVGFDMAYMDKLFGVFNRLHKESDFEGTGIGLAIVKRIIERHGGVVWAESNLNKGATFYFTLPQLNSN